MTKSIAIIIGGLIVLVLVLFNVTYTVNFHELAIKTRFGKPDGVITEPGLHFKLPFFIDQVSKIDTRLQIVESPLETVLTTDQQQVLVQAFLFWRIDTDAAQDFYNSYGSVDVATRDLQTQLQGAVRTVGGFSFDQLIGQDSQLPSAEKAILADLQGSAITGIVPVSVGISQVVLPSKTTLSVLQRMSKVQESLAMFEQSAGAAEADAIKSQAASQADTIRNFAEQWAAQIEAVGNEEATRYYEQMKQEADLAIFLAWLDTFEAALGGNTTFVTDMSRAPFHIIDPDSQSSSSGIPLPSKRYYPSEGDSGKRSQGQQSTDESTSENRQAASTPGT